MMTTCAQAIFEGMTTSAHAFAAAARAISSEATTVPVLDVVIPVYNEEKDLASCVNRLHEYLRDRVPYRYRITIADNASTDRTLVIAQCLAREIPEVEVYHLDQK